MILKNKFMFFPVLVLKTSQLFLKNKMGSLICRNNSVLSILSEETNFRVESQFSCSGVTQILFFI